MLLITGFALIFRRIKIDLKITANHLTPRVSFLHATKTQHTDRMESNDWKTDARTFFCGNVLSCCFFIDTKQNSKLSLSCKIAITWFNNWSWMCSIIIPRSVGCLLSFRSIWRESVGLVDAPFFSLLSLMSSALVSNNFELIWSAKNGSPHCEQTKYHYPHYVVRLIEPNKWFTICLNNCSLFAVVNRCIWCVANLS